MSGALPLQSQGPEHLWSLELNRGKGGEGEGVCRTEEICINVSMKFCTIGQCPTKINILYRTVSNKIFCRTVGQCLTKYYNSV